MNLVQDQVVAGFGVLAGNPVAENDDLPRHGQQVQQPGMAAARHCGQIQQPQEERYNRAHRRRDGHDDQQPAQDQFGIVMDSEQGLH